MLSVKLADGPVDDVLREQAHPAVEVTTIPGVIGVAHDRDRVECRGLLAAHLGALPGEALGGATSLPLAGSELSGGAPSVGLR